MDKETIRARIKLLESERDQLKGNVIAYDGAIQDCQFWLTKIVDVSATTAPVKPIKTRNK